MNHFSKKEGSKRNSIIFMLLAFILLFSTAVFAQTTNLHVKNGDKESLENTERMNTIKQESNPDSSNISFVLWFMGAKLDQNTIVLPIKSTEIKQFKTFGITPNRLLIRTFFKKVVNFEVAIT